MASWTCMVEFVAVCKTLSDRLMWQARPPGRDPATQAITLNTDHTTQHRPSARAACSRLLLFDSLHLRLSPSGAVLPLIWSSAPCL